MSILGLLGLGGLCIADSAKHNATMRRNCNRMESQGAFLPSSGQRGDMIYQDIVHDWLGERELFPVEYWEYFERNEKARFEYMFALQCKQEIDEGYKPSYCMGIYNQFTYSPFADFHACYDEKIKILNETGRLYF